ncbi:MAG: tRNA lysidine(34) synthetase TilS [Gammaproteobacteria bacterium]|nr:tRNA lysidine(34) synthetase TilS [Gammaproteobacteria bacterium]
MLQLLRGAGLRGLSAMPEVQSFAAGFLVRPLLGFSREAMGDYAERHALEWIEDSSNTNLAYDRNYLRHKVMPSLYERWPAARSTIARAAGLAAETITLAETLARQDLIKTRDVADNALNVPVLRSDGLLDRRRNLLRIWIRDQGLPVPSASILERITGEVLNAAADREPLVSWEQAEIRRYRDKLYILPVLPEATPAMRLVWDRVTLPLPLGELCYHRTQGRGLNASVLTDYRPEIRFRLGGESIRPAGRGRRRRNVKKLLQEYSVPPWLRDRMPLIYVGDTIVAAIAGITRG